VTAMTPRRLVFVAPAAYRLSGLATWLNYLLPGLEELGWEATLALVDGRHHDAEHYIHLHPWPRHVKVTNPTGAREGRVRVLAEMIAELGPQIVVSVNIPDSVDAVAHLRHRGHATKVVMSLHAIQQDLIDDAAGLREELDGVIYTNRLHRLLLMTASPFAPERLFYAPCGVAVAPLARRPAAADDPFRILWSGRLDQADKRALDLPRILDRLDDRTTAWRLEIAGDGPEREAIQDQISSRRYAERVRFLGHVPHADLLERVLPTADVLLFTSARESSPLTLWEAMAAGVPVVSSRFLGCGFERALVDGQNCMMFDVGDSDGAARRLIDATDAQAREAIALAGRRLVETAYNRAHSVGAWHDALQRTLALTALPATPPRKRPPTGRLDRILGAGGGEVVRRLLRRRFEHAGPGAEWPHSYGRRDDTAFLDRATYLDGRDPVSGSPAT
jgi:glycosyltransferase involved in cell wall biosynthesis